MKAKRHIFKNIIILVLIILLLFVIVVIRGDYKAVRNKFAGVVFLKHFISERDNAINIGNNTVLSNIVPSFEYLVNLEKKNETFDISRFETYINYFNKLIEFFPYNAEAYGLLGYCSYKLGNSRQAIKFYDKAIELNPNIFGFYYNLGVLFFEEDNYSEAKNTFTKAITTNTEYVINFMLTSSVYRQLYSGLSYLEYNSVIKKRLQANYENCFRLLVLSDFYLRNFSDMFKNSRQAIKYNLDPKGDFYYYAGVSLFEQGQYNDAYNYFKECLKRNPKNVSALKKLGLSLHKMGQKEIARKIFKKTMSLYQNNNLNFSKKKKRNLGIF